MLTVAQARVYQKAGYDVVLSYESWLRLTDAWVPKHFPTTKDALCLHESVLSIRTKHGEIRNVVVIDLTTVK